MAELRIENLIKSYGGTAVVDSVSLTVAEGEFCILLGPSGCGKSTILRLVAGLERQDRGAIYIGGSEVSARDPKDRDVAMVFQSYALYPHLSVYENIAFPLKVRGLAKREIDRKVREAARMLDITDLLGRRPREISGGQRQRVAIGRAIVRSPKLFLFDEPLSNLDAKLRASMRVELAGLHRRLRATTLYVTHDQIEAMTLGEKIVLLDRGTVQQEGSPRDLYDRPANLFAASFIGMPAINLFPAVPERSEAGISLRLPEFGTSIGIGPDLQGSLDPYVGKKITVGVRPEAVRFEPVGPEEVSREAGGIVAALEHAEHMGAEVILYFQAGARKIVSRTSGDFRPSLGQRFIIRFEEDSLHFFYEDRRI